MKKTRVDPRVITAVGDYIREGLHRGMSPNEIAQWLISERQVKPTPQTAVLAGAKIGDAVAVGDLVQSAWLDGILIRPYGVPHKVVDPVQAYMTSRGSGRYLVKAESLLSGRASLFMPNELVRVRLI